MPTFKDCFKLTPLSFADLRKVKLFNIYIADN